MQNSFSYERFCTYARFETEAQENSEMVYIDTDCIRIALHYTNAISIDVTGVALRGGGGGGEQRSKGSFCSTSVLAIFSR